jgi:hypothetical protein
MKKWICFALVFQTLDASAQPGFNKTYSFEQEQITGSAFANVLLDNDTLVLFGTCYPPVTPPGQQALLFVKMDTLGNVLMHKCHLDPDAPLDEYAAAPNYEIIKTADGGYALTGSNLASDKGLLIKFSHTGDIEFYTKYGTPPNAQNRLIRKVLEINGGYLLAGTLFFNDQDIFLMKVDKQGNFLWEKTYGQPGVVDVMGSLIKINDNHFAIGAQKAKNPGSPPYNASNTWVKSWLIEIDSLGNIINSSESPLNVQGGIGGLKKMADGWLYGTIEFEILNQFEWGQHSKILRTGEDISDVIWEKQVSSTTLLGNTISDIKPTPDGNWVAIGQWATPIPPPPDFGHNYLGGSTFKFTSDGDSLWARLDTAFWHPVCVSENYLGGVAVLPSGSIIAVGYANSYCYPPTPRSYGWVLKISKDGCIDTLGCGPVSTVPVVQAEAGGILAYPNPARSGWNVESAAVPAHAELYDSIGHRLKAVDILSSEPHYLDAGGLPPGIYMLRLTDANTNLPLGSRKLVLLRE